VEHRWIQTQRGVGWFVYFRVHGPEAPAVNNSRHVRDFTKKPETARDIPWISGAEVEPSVDPVHQSGYIACRQDLPEIGEQDPPPRGGKGTKANSTALRNPKVRRPG
jgi:hypothetical protein